MKVKILNMACGHCRLKIESELRTAGFEYIDFDMLNDVVSLRDDEGTLLNAKKAVKTAGYIVDDLFKEETSEHVIDFKYTFDIEEIKSAFEKIEASIVNVNGNQVKVNYEGLLEDVLEILDVYGIEYEES